MVTNDVIFTVVDKGRHFAQHFHNYLTGRNIKESKEEMQELLNYVSTFNLNEEAKIKFFFFGGSSTLDRLFLEPEQAKYTKFYTQLLIPDTTVEQALLNL